MDLCAGHHILRWDLGCAGRRQAVGLAPDTQHAAGQLKQAWETWQRALDILETCSFPDADKIRQARQYKRPRLFEPFRIETRRSRPGAFLPQEPHHWWQTDA
jgi:hypothetical protein